MPCSDPYADAQAANDLAKENRKLEAVICAIFTELIRASEDGVLMVELDELMKNAQANGQVDIRRFWAKHRQNDFNRMRKELNRYSSHELDIIHSILQERLK